MQKIMLTFPCFRSTSCKVKAYHIRANTSIETLATASWVSLRAFRTQSSQNTCPLDSVEWCIFSPRPQTQRQQGCVKLSFLPLSHGTVTASAYYNYPLPWSRSAFLGATMGSIAFWGYEFRRSRSRRGLFRVLRCVKLTLNEFFIRTVGLQTILE